MRQTPPSQWKEINSDHQCQVLTHNMPLGKSMFTGKPHCWNHLLLGTLQFCLFCANQHSYAKGKQQLLQEGVWHGWMGLVMYWGLKRDITIKFLWFFIIFNGITHQVELPMEPLQEFLFEQSRSALVGWAGAYVTQPCLHKLLCTQLWVLFALSRTLTGGLPLHIWFF